MNSEKIMFPVTVVIPSLGGDSLKGTIEIINKSTIVPNEILVCIPEDYSDAVEQLSFPNLKIVKTKCKGQVAQRAVGFSQAKCEYVMQIDDDCVLEKNAIETLINIINASTIEIAVAPQLISETHGQSFYNRSKPMFYENVFSLIINGTKRINPGSITKAGVNFGIDFNNLDKKIVEVDWLPGGCVMFRKKTLILENYFPFRGKAYCEDLIHSFMLKKNGVKLYITSKSSCKTNIEIVKSDFVKICKETYKEHRARKYFISISGGSRIREFTFFVLNLCYKMYKSIVN